MHDHSVSFLEKAPQLKIVAGVIWVYGAQPPPFVNKNIIYISCITKIPPVNWRSR
jgi:hypothetical protein